MNAGADTFFVARLEEGIAVRELLPRERIFVMDGIASGAAPAHRAGRIFLARDGQRHRARHATTLGGRRQF